MTYQSDNLINDQFDRLKISTQCWSHAKLANLLGVRPNSIAYAKHKGKIPPSWLLTLVRYRHINPEWILTGNGPCYLSPSPTSEGRYETGYEYFARMEDLQAVRRLPSYLLADELLRRIVVSQGKEYCQPRVKSKTED